MFHGNRREEKSCFFKKVPQSPQYFLPDAAHDSENVQQSFLAQELAREITCRKERSATLITLCIGTDKITGDWSGAAGGHQTSGTRLPPPGSRNIAAPCPRCQSSLHHFCPPRKLRPSLPSGHRRRRGPCRKNRLYFPFPRSHFSRQRNLPAAATSGQFISDRYRRRGVGALRRRPALHKTFRGKYSGGFLSVGLC